MQVKNKPTPDLSGDEGHLPLAGRALAGCGCTSQRPSFVYQQESRLPPCSSTSHPLKSHPFLPWSSHHPTLGPRPGPFLGLHSLKTPVILLPKYDHLKPSFFNFTYTTSPWAFNTAENSIPPWDFTSYYLSTHLPLCCSPPQDRFPLVIVTYPAEITQSQAPLSLEFTLNSSVVDYPHTRADLNGASLAPLWLLNAHWSHYLNWTVNSLTSFTHHTKQDQPTPGTATGWCEVLRTHCVPDFILIIMML